MESCIIYSRNPLLYQSNLAEDTSEFGLESLNKLCSAKKKLQFVNSKSEKLENPLVEFCLMIEDEFDNIAKLIKYSNDSGAIKNLIICTDAESTRILIDRFSNEPNLITLDFQLRNGDQFIEETTVLYNYLKEKWKVIPVIGITNWEGIKRDNIKDLIELINSNGDSVYEKQLIWKALPTILRDKLRIRLLSKENEQLNKKLSKAEKDLSDLKKTLGIDLKTRTESTDFATLKDPLIGESLKMKEVRFHVELAAKDQGNVLLLGETGTGKELVAKAIHKLSGKKKEIVIVNCAAIPETLIESELFGVIANFPGFHNIAKKIGFFERAIGSTLFLDEIHHMSLPAQAKVLRAIDDRKFYSLGGESPIELGDETRIIAATKPNIEELIEEGKFLEDLFGRLNSFMPVIPPLSERTEDILELIEHFFTLKKSTLVLNQEAKEILVKHIWKRNVRELRNFVFGLHNLYSGAGIVMTNLGTMPKQTLIEADHIKYALSLHNKKSSDEKLILQVVGGVETNVSKAAKQSDEPDAKKLFQAIIKALELFASENKVSLEELAARITMPGKGKTGTAKQHLSTEFNKYKDHFKTLMSSPEFSGKLLIAMKYGKLKKILTT